VDPIDENPSKKLKIDDVVVVVDENKQVCWYDGNCKQKNPVHWTTYKHTKQTAPIEPPTDQKKVSKISIGYASSSSSTDDYPTKKLSAKLTLPKVSASKKKIASSSSDEYQPTVKSTKTPIPPKPRRSLSSLLGENPLANAGAMREGLVNYKNMMRYFLTGHEITGEKKKMLLEIRKKEEITKEEHEAMLGTFGWTTEEYEIGEREPQHDFDLKEELEVYKKDDGFQIITLTHDQKLNKEQEAVWSKVSAKFFSNNGESSRELSNKIIGCYRQYQAKKGIRCSKEKIRR